MSRKMLLVAAALLCGACAAPAPKPQGTGTQSAAVADAQRRKDKVVCRMERATGSNIAERVCRPEGADTRDQQELQDRLLQMRSLQNRTGG